MNQNDEREKLLNGTIWSFKNISNAVMNTLFTSCISFYATDVLGMNLALAGTVLLITKLFDGFTDMIAGFVIDNTHTRWGKGKALRLVLLF